nr:MAG TPA: hypothetical protein [Caudoviricetes sp.]
MKQQNKARQALLQKKRTKRNQKRKGVKYDPNKRVALQLPGIIQAAVGTSDSITDETRLVL